MSQSKSQKKQTWVKRRHTFWRILLTIPILIYLRLAFCYRHKRLKYDTKKQYFILCNHQTDLDVIMLYVGLHRVIYPLTTDSLFSNKLAGKFIMHTFAPIPKRKGVADQKAIKTLLQVVHEGGDVMIFPEGNRTYAEFQYAIDPSIIKLVKKCKLPLMLLNINGGTGVSPRFAKKHRNGKTTLCIKRIIPFEEYNSMSNEELLKIIEDSLRVYDSESGSLFKSNAKAEYLERMLFLCPKCGKTQNLKSEGNYLQCTCGLNVEFTENLKLRSDTPGFSLSKLNDWYQLQRKWAREVEIIDNQVIFSDQRVCLYISHVNEKRRLIASGRLTLTNKELNFNDQVRIPIEELLMASPISGRKFNFSTKDESYLVIGDERFNPLKYVFMFNRLETKMKGQDLYYDIYD